MIKAYWLRKFQNKNFLKVSDVVDYLLLSHLPHMKIQKKDKYIIHAISLACFRFIITGQEQKQARLQKIIEGTISLEMARKG